MEQNNNNNIKRKALGKGLEELFSSEPMTFDTVETTIINETPKDEIVNIKLDDLRPNPYQPRKVFDEESLKELANSIKEHGVFQPIIVKKSIKGYEIIAGERRVKASKLAGLTEISAIVREFNDEEMMEIALLENLERENLTPLEEAEAYKGLIDKLSITQEELANRHGKSRSYITNTLGILSLPEKVKTLINDKKLSMGHAKILSKLESEEEKENLAEKVVNEGISVHSLEEIVNKEKIEKKVKQHKIKDTKYDYLEDELSEKFGTRVKINNNKLTLAFTNDNDLNRILEIMHLGS